MMILINGIEYEPTTEESKAVSIECWYDRHTRLWTLYPVDENGYQLDGATYAYGKAEAMRVKKELEEEYIK